MTEDNLGGKMEGFAKTQDELPEGEPVIEASDMVPIKRQGNKYVKLMKKGKEDGSSPDVWGEISNCTMNLLRDEIDVDHPDNAQKITRVIQFNSGEAASWAGRVEADELASLRAFKTLLVSRGDFAFYGNSQADLDRVWHMALQDSKATRKRVLVKSISGLEPSSGHFIVENGAIGADGQLYERDADGLININGDYYRLNGNDRTTKAEDSRLPSFNFDLSVDPQPNFVKLLHNTQKLWGDNIELLWGWGIAHLFRSLWMDKEHNFPLCMIPCPPGMGKNTLMYLFLKLFGLPLKPHSLQGMTTTGYYTTVNSACDVPVWIDEWKNSASEVLREMFKANYDGSLKTVGTLDPFQVKSREHRTGCLITGEFRPTDNALNQRCILVNLKRVVDKQLLDDTKLLCGGISALSVKLLKDRKASWEAQTETYKAIVNRWQQDLVYTGKVDIRVVENYAKAFAALQLVDGSDTAKRTERFEKAMLTKVTESGNANLAVEAVSYMARYNNGGDGRRGWIPCYMNRNGKFGIDPKIMIKVYCEKEGIPNIPLDDLFKYSQEAGLLLPSQTSPATTKMRLKMSADGDSLDRRGWLLNMDNETVRDVAEELASKCGTERLRQEGSKDDAPTL